MLYRGFLFFFRLFLLRKEKDLAQKEKSKSILHLAKPDAKLFDIFYWLFLILFLVKIEK
jgi:hypothetical protein